MAGIQEVADDPASCSPGVITTPTSIIVQAPVPPQFADDPETQNQSLLVEYNKHNDNFFVQNASNFNDGESQNTQSSNEPLLCTPKNASDETSSTTPVDQSMVSFLPMSATLEDDSVVNLTRF